MLNTATLIDAKGPSTERLSKKENHDGWFAYVRSLEAIAGSVAVTTAYSALCASEFDFDRPGRPAHELVTALSDIELEMLVDVVEKSAGFERPAGSGPYTARSFRVRKGSEALALITNVRMHRLVDLANQGRVNALKPQSPPTSRRSARADL